MASSQDSQHADARTSEAGSSEAISLTLTHNGTPHTFNFLASATLSDLSSHISQILSIPPSNQKFVISPKPGLLKPPFTDTPQASIPLSILSTRRIQLLGSTSAQVASLNSQIHASSTSLPSSLRARAAAGPIKAATPSKSRDFKTIHAATTYTFLQLRPLPHLPNPSRSLAFLERLRDDAGIKSTMAKHKWSVPLLIEMDPVEHTTHESRTLGLNRNAGEVIELRLRTDAYDGYRDYKTIRKTLCHELAHNVWGEHDKRFWDLCHEVEREVERGDWRTGGRAVGDEVFYAGGGGGVEEEEVMDHGGWTGGEFVLGSGQRGGRLDIGSSVEVGTLSRREVLAKAAEERLKKQKEQQRQGKQSGA